MECDPTRMCELLVGLGDVEVLGVADSEGGPLRVHVRRRALRPPCEGCGGALWSDGERAVELVDLPAFGRSVRLVWHKRRWRCPRSGCWAGTVTEQAREIALPRERLTSRARLSTWTRANARSPGVTATAGCWSPRCQYTSPRKRYSSEVKRTGTSWLPSPLAARPALESLLVSAADTDVPVVASAISIAVAVAAPSTTEWDPARSRPRFINCVVRLTRPCSPHQSCPSPACRWVVCRGRGRRRRRGLRRRRRRPRGCGRWTRCRWGGRFCWRRWRGLWLVGAARRRGCGR